MDGKLHLECIRRNSKADLAKATPIPTVREVPALAHPIPVPIFWAVPDYVNCDYVPFVQPSVYITREDDRFTTYDADSGDEEWLSKVNNDCYRENSVSLLRHLRKLSFIALITKLMRPGMSLFA
ncbi:hypothetical protein MKX03_020543 [Papaver bracteatum]|nr:hypothetical protein MKX03_020543 [Papaver bracteatum]